MLLHVRKENNEQTMNDLNEENHTHRFFDNHYSVEFDGFNDTFLNMLAVEPKT
jgi:hypothetical protein